MSAGFKVIHHGQVREARTLEEAAQLVAAGYPEKVRVKFRLTLTQDRDLTAPEVTALAEAAAKILTEVPV